jgi:transposase-like protein
MAKRKRRTFTTQFKAQAVRVVREIGKPIGTVARELDLNARLAEWRELLRRHVVQARQILRKLIVGRLTFTASNAGTRWYEFAGVGTLGN